jgi:hypothetical protein
MKTWGKVPRTKFATGYFLTVYPILKCQQIQLLSKTAVSDDKRNMFLAEGCQGVIILITRCSDVI